MSAKCRGFMINCAVFLKLGLAYFLFFVCETRFFFVYFCFIKLIQTAGIVDYMTCATILALAVKTYTYVPQIKRD